MTRHRGTGAAERHKRPREMGFWYLSCVLLAMAAGLCTTIGLPPLPSGSPSSVLDSLERAAQAGPGMPTMIDLELFFRSPSPAQLAAGGVVLDWWAWWLWLWLFGTTVLRVSVVLGERGAAANARWPKRLRRISDRITLSIVRQTVDAALAGGMLLRSVAPVSIPVSTPAVAQSEIRWNAFEGRLYSEMALTPEKVEMAPDLQPGDVLYTVQSGDTLSEIADRFYGDPVAFNRIVESNLGRPQPDGRTLRKARFIYPGWQLVVPGPTQGVFIDSNGERRYIVRWGDTLSGISARLLGDAQRYPELFSDNEGASLDPVHVLTNPDLIWPGLVLRLPSEPGQLPQETPEPGAVIHSPVPTTIVPTPPIVSTTRTPVTPAQTMTTPGGGANLVEATPEVLPTGVGAPTAEDDQGRSNGLPPLGLPGDATVAGALVAAVTAGALLAVYARRRRRPRPEPETETRVDVHAFTVAEPAAVVAGRTAGISEDPHGLVLGELLAGELLRRARVAELVDVEVVSVMAGRSGAVVTLSAPLEDRALLETAVRTEAQLARRADVSRSPDQDVVVRLQGVRSEALSRVSVGECPVLLCVGMAPDTRSYMVGWDALGHVLAASQPGTNDAEEHLAALVAMLAGQLSPAELQLFTVAGPDTWLRGLAPLPHQRAVIDPTDTEATNGVLRGLRTELERRQLAQDSGPRQRLVLVAGELADIVDSEDFGYLVSEGDRFGIRVVAATSNGDVQRGSTVDQFASHLVFGLEDEQASTNLLGNAWALTLAEPGRVLARLARRNAVELLGVHLTEESRHDLLASMGLADEATAPTLGGSEEIVREREEIVREVAREAMAQVPLELDSAPLAGGAGLPDPDAVYAVTAPGTTSDSTVAAADAASEQPQCSDEADNAIGERAALQSGVVIDERTVTPPTPVDASVPDRIGRLLARAPLVVDCEEASVWSAEGRLGMGQSSPIEVLVYVAAAPLLDQGHTADWSGVAPESLLADIWAPRARDPDHRDSAQTWLGKNLGRLQEEIRKLVVSVGEDVIVKRGGYLRLNEAVIVSDVAAFMMAVERARGARGADQVASAEDAFGTRVPGLLTRVVRNPRTSGPKVEFYRWLGQPEWERAAGRLEALGRDAALILARSYRDLGRYEEALTMYEEVLGAEQLDPRACEGLLLAAAGTGDAVRLDDAWQQVCACLGGEGDLELRALYDRLRRGLIGAAASSRSEATPARR